MIKSPTYPIYSNDFNFTIAMAYVPYQGEPVLNECLEDGFIQGTIFPELEKPFLGRRSCCS